MQIAGLNSAILFLIGMTNIFANIAICQEPIHEIDDMKAIETSIKTARQEPTVEKLKEADKRINAFEREKHGISRFRYAAQLLLIISTKLEVNKRQNVPKPSLNVVPPFDPKTGSVTSGISPENIKDPKLRKKYKDDIAENSRNAEFWNETSELEHLEGTRAALLGYEAASLFGTNSNAINQVKRELTDQGLSEKLILRVIEHLKERS